MAIHCPSCNAEISDADFNVATDMAYCRECKTNYKYSDLATRVEPTRLDLSQVPKHVTVEETMSGMRMVYKKWSPVVLFLIPFTCLWSGGSMTGIYIVPLLRGNLKLHEALFGIPFFLGSIVLVSVIIFLLFGSWIVVSGRDESYVSVGVGPFRWKRTFDLGKLRTVGLRASKSSQNGKNLQVIELKFEDDSTLAFGSTIEESSQSFIAQVMASLAAK